MSTNIILNNYPQSILINKNDNSQNIENELILKSSYEKKQNQSINENENLLSNILINHNVFESQVSYNLNNGIHEEQLIRCDNLNNLNESYSFNCLNSFLNNNFDFYISGWRRNLLIIILIFNFIIAIVNAATIIWIVSYYYLSNSKFIEITSNEIIFDGYSHFEKSLTLNSLSSIKNETRIRSNSIIAQENETRTKLSMDESGHLIGNADQLSFYNQEGISQMMINENEFFLASNKIKIINDYRLNLDKSIQTKQLISNDNLSIVSLNKKVVLETSASINLSSKKNIFFNNNSTEPMSFNSKLNKVILKTNSIELINLPTFVSSEGSSYYPDIYQLCICPNGKLFADKADGHCMTEKKTCQ